MKWLVYGGRGWIGGQVVECLRRRDPSITELFQFADSDRDTLDTIVYGTSRLDDYHATRQEIVSTAPDRVICCTGLTGGPGCPNIDYLESLDILSENLRDNLHGPLNLAIVCQERSIHMTYFGTGCIYDGEGVTLPTSSEQAESEQIPPGTVCGETPDGTGFTELDPPNFQGSAYSTVKGVTDQLLQNFPNVLILRLRLPVMASPHPRNLLTKLLGYSTIVSIPNSISILPELLPVALEMAVNETIGTFNFCNPGVISHQEILEMYQQVLEKWPTPHSLPMPVYRLVEPSLAPGKAKRSNTKLNTLKLEALVTITPIKKAMKRIITEYIDNVSTDHRA